MECCKNFKIELSGNLVVANYTLVFKRGWENRVWFLFDTCKKKSRNRDQ